MKKLIFTVSILASIFSNYVNSADYADAYITGVGVAPGESRVRFTVDATPDHVWITDKYSGDQLNRLVSLIMVAYTSGKKVAFMRTDDDPSQSSYLNVVHFEVGAITHD